MTAGLPDFDELERDLDQVHATMGAAEAQGLMCGLVCASGRLDEAAWAGQLLPDTPLPEAGAGSRLRALARTTLTGMNDSGLGLTLLLPDDSIALRRRAAALGEWCQGFLLGLGVGGLGEPDRLPDNVQEILRDLSEIARVEFDTDSVDEEDERAYMEITEYVRMGVLLINEELQPVKAPPRLQ